MMRDATKNVLVVSAFLFTGCGGDAEPKQADKKPQPSATTPAKSERAEPTDDGETPESTLEAYYYYGDRGQQSKLDGLIVNNIFEGPLEDGPGRDAATIEARGLVVDHKEEKGDEAILYYRTWFSPTAEKRGGRPTVARLIREEGVWKVDVKETLKLTMQNTKGKTKFGFYDGSKAWWKE